MDGEGRWETQSLVEGLDSDDEERWRWECRGSNGTERGLHEVPREHPKEECVDREVGLVREESLVSRLV